MFNQISSSLKQFLIPIDQVRKYVYWSYFLFSIYDTMAFYIVIEDALNMDWP